MARQIPRAVGIGIAILVIVTSGIYVFNTRENETETTTIEDIGVIGDEVISDDVAGNSVVDGKSTNGDDVIGGDDVTDDGVIDIKVIGQIVAEREKLDATVWSDEVTAQKYEEPFIDLWDRMRGSEDQIGELAKFAFEDLTLGMPGEPTRHDHKIDAFRGDNGTMTFDPVQWKSWLSDWSNSGLQIIQSEWHHSRFEPDKETPRSVVSFVLHLVNTPENIYYSIRGKLVVHWKPVSTPSDKPQARSIEATDFTVLSRQALPMFEEAAILKINSQSRLLLIANDVDGDGLSELISPSENILYWNRGDFRFEPTKLFDIPPGGPDFAGVMADFTGDGRPDFLGSNPEGSIFLYEADEKRNFSTKPRIVRTASDIREPTVITAGDIDADGDLDVWIGQYRNPYRGGQMPTPYFDANDGYPAYLLRNDGNGVFEDITESCGLSGKRNRRTYSASLVDLDGDLDLDLVVVSDFSGVDVYTNDGAGKFRDVTDEKIENRHAFGMSLSFSDYDADSNLDFFMTGMSSTTALRLHQMDLGRDKFQDYQSVRPEMGYGNRMYLAKGQDFEQATFNDQVARTGWSWGSTSFDFDNDGDRDVFVANGHKSQSTAKDYCTAFWCHDIYTGSSTANPELGEFFKLNAKLNFGVEGISWNGFEHNALLMNNDGEGFLRIEFLAGVASEFDSRNVISDDLNGDGRVDLLVLCRSPVSRERSIYVLQNKNDSNANWIGVRLDGTSRSGLGARVTVKTPDRIHVAAVVSGDSYVSQHASVVHFGLGSSTQVQEIQINWPDGAFVKIPGPEINRYHQIQSTDIIVP